MRLLFIKYLSQCKPIFQQINVQNYLERNNFTFSVQASEAQHQTSAKLYLIRF